MNKSRSNQMNPSDKGEQLPELNLQELAAVRGGRCFGRGGCGGGRRPN